MWCDFIVTLGRSCTERYYESKLHAQSVMKREVIDSSTYREEDCGNDQTVTQIVPPSLLSGEADERYQQEY